MKVTEATARRGARDSQVEIQWGEDVAVALSGESADEPPPEADLKRWAIAALGVRDDPVELCIRIVDEQEIKKLNHQFRGRDAVTNVLSFPCELSDEAGLRLLGDVVICAERAREEAAQQGKSANAHWAHLVTHGVLHLLGYDHEEEGERTAMETLEIELLAGQGFANPYEIVDEVIE